MPRKDWVAVNGRHTRAVYTPRIIACTRLKAEPRQDSCTTAPLNSLSKQLQTAHKIPMILRNMEILEKKLPQLSLLSKSDELVF